MVNDVINDVTQWVAERLEPFNIMVRKMAVKTQHFKMQSASFWTVRYQPYTKMNIDIGQMQELKFSDEEKKRIDSKLKFSSHIVNQVKKAVGWWVFSKIIQFSRYSFIQVFVYFPCLPSSWILCYGLVFTTKKRLRFNRKHPSLCFQDVTTVIKFNLWSTKYRRMHGDMIMVYKVLNGCEPSLENFLHLIIIR